MISRSLDGNRPLARIGESFATRDAPADGRTPAGGCAWPLDYGSAHRQAREINL